MFKALIWRPLQRILDFVSGSATGGLVLTAASVLATAVANSLWQERYQRLLETHLGPLSVLHWVNDGLMAVFSCSSA